MLNLDVVKLHFYNLSAFGTFPILPLTVDGALFAYLTNPTPSCLCVCVYFNVINGYFSKFLLIDVQRIYMASGVSFT